jgi:hypothetical protein
VSKFVTDGQPAVSVPAHRRLDAVPDGDDVADYGYGWRLEVGLSRVPDSVGERRRDRLLALPGRLLDERERRIPGNSPVRLEACSRCVSGIPATLGAARTLEMPGTTSKGTPSSARCRASSPPRPKPLGSPPLSRATGEADASGKLS